MICSLRRILPELLINRVEIGGSREKKNTQKYLFCKREGNEQPKGLGVEEIMILKWILNRWGGRVWAELIKFRIGTSDELL
jgi:hypothetical protein